MTEQDSVQNVTPEHEVTHDGLVDSAARQLYGQYEGLDEAGQQRLGRELQRFYQKDEVGRLIGYSADAPIDTLVALSTPQLDQDPVADQEQRLGRVIRGVEWLESPWSGIYVDGNLRWRGVDTNNPAELRDEHQRLYDALASYASSFHLLALQVMHDEPVVLFGDTPGSRRNGQVVGTEGVLLRVTYHVNNERSEEVLVSPADLVRFAEIAARQDRPAREGVDVNLSSIPFVSYVDDEGIVRRRPREPEHAHHDMTANGRERSPRQPRVRDVEALYGDIVDANRYEILDDLDFTRVSPERMREITNEGLERTLIMTLARIGEGIAMPTAAGKPDAAFRQRMIELRNEYVSQDGPLNQDLILTLDAYLDEAVAERYFAVPAARVLDRRRGRKARVRRSDGQATQHVGARQNQAAPPARRGIIRRARDRLGSNRSRDDTHLW
ncbi:MAG TPA: hypothetical protein VMB52_01890 [Verrucomicrobiae bacterium]|nr:hypothetical protein [Verrucomicrobiae bacterium]